jgi:Ca2+-binding EF-hand superfamily protein
VGRREHDGVAELEVEGFFQRQISAREITTRNLGGDMKDLSTGQLAELRQNFDLVDRNGDGWILAEEFIALLQALDQELSRDECLLAFEATDADGDGSISFEEFIEWWTGE